MGKLYIAIDPGASGGIAWSMDGVNDCVPMPDTEKDISDLLADLQRKAQDKLYMVECTLEKVHSMPGQGVSSSFKFGEHFGYLKGTLTTLGIRLLLVPPQTWMKTMGLGTMSGSASKTEWKNKLKAEAQRRNPEKKVTLKTADALLLLDYAKTQS